MMGITQEEGLFSFEKLGISVEMEKFVWLLSWKNKNWNDSVVI